MPTVSDAQFIRLRLPQSWQGLTPRQLSFLCALLAAGHQGQDLAHRMLLHCAALTPAKPPRGADPNALYVYHPTKGRPLQIDPDHLADLLQCFDFIATPPTAPLLPPIDTHWPQSPHLYDLHFGQYLELQRTYALFLDTHDTQHLDTPIRILWQYKEGETIPTDHLPTYHVALHLFMATLPPWLSQAYPHLFATTPDDNQNPDTQAQIETANAMIRALTAGDITKEPTILQALTHRALYELNQKAREAEELRKAQQA